MKITEAACTCCGHAFVEHDGDGDGPYPCERAECDCDDFGNAP